MCKVVLYTHCSTQIVFKNLASKYLKLEKKKKLKVLQVILHIKFTKFDVLINMIGLKFQLITKIQILKLKCQEIKEKNKDIGGFTITIQGHQEGLIIIIIIFVKNIRPIN